MATRPQLELKLGEENEIDFNLKIEGSDSDLTSTKPKIRFALTEIKTGRGWIFGAQKNKEQQEGGQSGGVAVVIPDMKNLVSEGEIYEGKLEVILGTRYFIPTEIDIRFKEPLKVEASLVGQQSIGQKQLNEGTSVEAVVVPVVKEHKPSLSYSDLDEGQKQKANALFVQKCKALGIEKPQNYFKEGTSYTKKRLSALMAQALLEVKNTSK